MNIDLRRPDGRAGNASSNLRVEICASDDALPALRPHWEALLGRVPAYSVSQTFGYASQAWQFMRKANGVALAVVLVWRDERLAAVWPLHTRRRSGMRVAMHLGAGAGEEYSGALIEKCADEGTVAALALEAAMNLADVLEAYAVRPDSPIGEALSAKRAFKYENTLEAPIVTLAGVQDFETWVMGKSRSFRQGLRADRKRLGERGAVSSVKVSGSAEAGELVDWVFESKRSWLAERGITHSWLLEPEGRQLFAALIGREGEPALGRASVHGFGLKLDGAFLAAGVFFRSHDKLEFFVSGFDPAFYAYSPGNLLIEDAARWAIAEGIDLDFRTTQDAYKLRWADRTDTYRTHILACGPKGAARVLRLELNRLVRRFRIWGGAKLRSYRASKKTTAIAPKS